MKALIMEEYNKFMVREADIPELEPGWVLIKVETCSICGSDVHGMDGSTGRRIPPVIMGHEAAGTIAKVAPDVFGWEIGDRVTFDSTISRRRSLPSRVRSPTPAKTEKPSEPIATLLINSMIKTVLPTPAPPNSPILPPRRNGWTRSMTLMPVSNISSVVACSSNDGAWR